MKFKQILIPTMALLLTTASCWGKEMTLKQAFKGRFHIGTAFGNRVFKEEGGPTLKLMAKQFNTVSPENAMKWQPFQPKPEKYNHKPADDFIEFASKNKMYVLAHVLFWHNQTPDWVFKDDKGKQLDRKQLLKRMRERVQHVAGRYKGKIHAWDVVNECFEGGKLRNSKWTQIVGKDFLEQAFRIADEELPKDVELLYNDYSMTGKGKRDAVVKMVQELKKKGVRIDGVGMQGHWSLNGPSIAEIEKSIVAFAATGVKVHITELDIDVLPRHPKMWSGNADIKLKLQNDPKLNPYKDGLPEAIQKQLAARYADIFKLFLKHQDKIKRVTFWGPYDGQTWLNNWPIKGRTNHPLLFDRDRKPKPAFQAVLDAAKEAK